MRFFRSALLGAGLFAACCGGAALVPQTQAQARAWAQPWVQTPVEGNMPAQCDNARFVQDQAGYMRQFGHQHVPYGQHLELPEHVCGQVVRVYRARRSRSGWHGYFLMTVPGGRAIRIVSNLDEMNAPSWPWVQPGDQVEAQGRYYYDGANRQGLDWTHHGTSRHWPWAGFVAVNGQRYQ